MCKTLLCSALLAMVFFPTLIGRACAIESTVRFVVDKDSLAFRTIEIAEVTEGGEPSPLQLKEGAFEKRFESDDTDYYGVHTFRVRVDKDDAVAWNTAYQDVRFNLAVVIRPDESPIITIPVRIPEKLGRVHMDVLETMIDEYDKRDRLVQIAIAYNHFRSNFGPNDALTKRAAQIWFDTAYDLAAKKTKLFVITDDVMEAVKRSLPANIGRFTKSFMEAASLRFQDLAKFDSYLARGNCSFARAILTDLITFANEQPELLPLARIDRSHLDERQKVLSNECPDETV